MVPATAWTTPWVVRITPWGEGEEAVLIYLARYVFRIAITNSRIVALNEHTVSFRYKHRQSNRWRICTLDGAEFMRRFLQHVLPKGLHKVRYFGLWHPSKRPMASKARLLLHMQRANQLPPQLIGNCPTSAEHQHQSTAAAADLHICPRCGLGQLLFVRKLLRKAAARTMTRLPNTIRHLRVLAMPRPCTILLQFPPPVSTPLGSRRSLAAFAPFCLQPHPRPSHAISAAPATSTSLPSA
jgi:hypothetical protein